MPLLFPEETSRGCFTIIYTLDVHVEQISRTLLSCHKYYSVPYRFGSEDSTKNRNYTLLDF